jgi:hypothetical protein
MRIIRKPSGYVMNLSANETYAWAHRPGSSWPGSTLSGSRFMIEVDRNGLCDIAIDGKRETDCDGTELGAIVSDHLPADLREFWPVWASVATA